MSLFGAVREKLSAWFAEPNLMDVIGTATWKWERVKFKPRRGPKWGQWRREGFHREGYWRLLDEDSD